MSRESEKFIELLKPVYNELVRYCRAMCREGNPDDAEDILQETLVKGYQKLYTLNDESKFKNWIFSIATREHKTFLRSRFWKHFLPLGNEHNKYGETPVYDRTDSDYEKKVLYHALSRLKEKERTAILLFEIGGLSIRDIADIQNEKSESAVKSRLARTRDKLKSFIEDAEKQNTKLNPAEGDIQNETLKIISGIERKGKKHGQVLG